MFSGCGGALAHMNSQPLRQHTKKPTQAKAREYPSMEKGDGHEVPPLSNIALATDRCWEKKSEFSLRNTPKLICKDICGLRAPT